MILFFASGLLTSSWLARLHDVAHGLNLTAGPMGVLLLAQTVGSFSAVSLSGVLVSRFGAQRCILFAYLLSVVGMCGLGLGVALSQVWIVALSLTGMGLGTAVSNVASNVQGVAVERALGRFVTPIMHGFFSIGTVVGAGIGALDTYLGVPFSIHMWYMAALILTLVLYALRLCFSENYGQDNTAMMAQVSAYRVKDAWRDKHTIFIGFFVLGMALAEGSANDWIALALTQEYGTTATIGSLGYFTFVAAMTTGRLAGTRLLNTYGRIPVLRVTCTLAMIGLIIFIFAPNAPTGFVGLVIWGLGASLGFPTGMSAASDDPIKSAVRVSVVSTIGYAAFLGGPPILGLLGEIFGIRHGLLGVLIFVAVSFAMTRYLEIYKKQEPIHVEILDR
nr:MFS transporter [Rothia sp. ZJ1223]